jgi:hypothetical protein
MKGELSQEQDGRKENDVTSAFPYEQPTEFAPLYTALNQAQVATQPTNTLSIYGLLNMSVMERQQTTGEYRDPVGDQTMEDFSSIILHFMDENLRKTFVSLTPQKLTETVRRIAEDDPGNKAFYNKLQVPFLVSWLARSKRFPRCTYHFS